MNADKKIAVIIINWKKYDLTLKCIDSVLKSSYKNFKIILIDNESQKSFPYEINKCEKIQIIKNQNNEGFSKANNQGIKYSIKHGFDYVLLLNNDTLIKNDLKSILNKATFVTLIFMLISSFILSYLYSGLGLAYALVLTELFSFSIHYYFINKK